MAGEERNVKRTPPPWHAEAEHLRASDWTVTEIARRFRKHHATVIWVLNENGQRRSHRDRGRLWWREHRMDLVDFYSQPGRASPNSSNRILASQEVKMAAIADFAAHRIDRATLMARITADSRQGAPQ